MNNNTRYNFLKGELVKRDIKMNNLSGLVGRSRTMIYKVMMGIETSRPIAAKLESLIDAEPGSLFPYVIDERKAAVNE